jgi:hypothetical protein
MFRTVQSYVKGVNGPYTRARRATRAPDGVQLNSSRMISTREGLKSRIFLIRPSQDVCGSDDAVGDDATVREQISMVPQESMSSKSSTQSDMIPDIIPDIDDDFEGDAEC